jgi:AcrR family transcriptional regulator
VLRSQPSAKGAATRQRILDCAISRFAVQGFRHTSVAQVARDAGLTPPAVHAHFGSKEDLFEAAFEHDVAGVLELIGTAVLDPVDGLTLESGMALMRALLDQLDAHPLARRVFHGGEPERTRTLLHIPAVARARERRVAAIAAAQRAGRVRADLEPAALAGALETLLLALLFAGAQVGMIGDDARRAAIVAVLRQGTAPAGSQP